MYHIKYTGGKVFIPVPVKTLLLWQPSLCDPAAETALQPLTWCFES